MKRYVSILVLFVLLCCLLLPGNSWAQAPSCQPTNQTYHLNDVFTDPNFFAIVTPSQVPNPVATASMSVNPGDGSQNHNITVGPGVQTTFTWVSQNGVSASGYYTIDGGSTHFTDGPWGNPGLSGNWTYTTTSGDVGHYRTYYYTVNDVTTDINTVTVTSGSGVIDEDEIPTNLYLKTNVYPKRQRLYEPVLLPTIQWCASHA